MKTCLRLQSYLHSTAPRPRRHLSHTTTWLDTQLPFRIIRVIQIRVKWAHFAGGILFNGNINVQDYPSFFYLLNFHSLFVLVLNADAAMPEMITSSDLSAYSIVTKVCVLPTFSSFIQSFGPTH